MQVSHKNCNFDQILIKIKQKSPASSSTRYPPCCKKGDVANLKIFICDILIGGGRDGLLFCLFLVWNPHAQIKIKEWSIIITGATNKSLCPACPSSLGSFLEETLHQKPICKAQLEQVCFVGLCLGAKLAAFLCWQWRHKGRREIGLFCAPASIPRVNGSVVVQVAFSAAPTIHPPPVTGSPDIFGGCPPAPPYRLSEVVTLERKRSKGKVILAWSIHKVRINATLNNLYGVACPSFFFTIQGKR